jgi:hypothetical protein
VSAQRAGSAVEPSHRSIHPNIPGLPWWAALLIATTGTAIGYAIDAGSGHKDLTDVFSFLYVAGCVVAVLVVRQSGVFTAVIQPPLILFCAVPGAYWLFHGGKVSNLKDLLINCGYPLIERFPLMLGTAGGVLLIGLIRWYLGLTHRSTTSADDAADVPETTETKSVIGGIVAKLASLLGRDADDEEDSSAHIDGAERVKVVERRSRQARSSRPGQGSDRRSAGSRSRHSRSPREQDYDTPGERRRQSSRRGATAREFDPDEPPRRPRRRPRPAGDYDPNAQAPRDTRRDSYGRRSAYERPAGRGFDPYGDFSPYEPYEPYEPPRRRAPNGAGPTHHPISQVRYRGLVSREARRDPYDDEPRPERRGRSRTPGRSRPPAESWEYDG